MGEPGRLTTRISQPQPRRHVIDRVDYSSCGMDYDSAPLDCACGWSGKAGAYAAHRSEAGQGPLRRANGSRVLVPRP